jgi:hypothetical protein
VTRNIKGCWWLVVAMASPEAVAAPQPLEIAVYVYNVAQVSHGMLRSAEHGAAKIFEVAGIKTTWREPHSSIPEDLETGSRGDPWIPTNIALKIYTRSMINELQLDEGAMGFVLRFETNSAVILYDRVQNLAEFKRIDIAPILGIAMAHEIGHLLLRSREHSSQGIMRRNWPSTDLQSGAQARLRFTAEQSRQMRDEVLRRRAEPPKTGSKIEVTSTALWSGHQKPRGPRTNRVAPRYKL